MTDTERHIIRALAAACIVAGLAGTAAGIVLGMLLLALIAAPMGIAGAAVVLALGGFAQRYATEMDQARAMGLFD